MSCLQRRSFLGQYCLIDEGRDTIEILNIFEYFVDRITSTIRELFNDNNNNSKTTSYDSVNKCSGGGDDLTLVKNSSPD